MRDAPGMKKGYIKKKKKVFSQKVYINSQVPVKNCRFLGPHLRLPQARPRLLLE